MIRLLILALLALPCWGAWGNGYSYCATVTLDKTKAGGETHSNFPVRIAGTYPQLATVANGGYATGASGYDIIFSSDPVAAGKLAHTVQSWTSTTGAIEAKLKAPSVSHTANTVVYVCVGNSGVTTDQTDPNNLYNSDYLAVYQLDETATPALDATASNLDLTTTGTLTWGGAGVVGKAVEFSNTQMLKSANTGYTGTALTFEGWFYAHTIPGSECALVAYGAGNYGQARLQIQTNHSGCGTTPCVVARIATDENCSIRVAATPTVNQWFHVATTIDITQAAVSEVILYLNGAAQTYAKFDGDTNNTTGFSNGPISVGAWPAGWLPFDGLVDEIRVSTVVRSAGWISASYNSQSDPGAFYAVGAFSNGAVSRRRVVIVQ